MIFSSSPSYESTSLTISAENGQARGKVDVQWRCRRDEGSTSVDALTFRVAERLPDRSPENVSTVGVDHDGSDERRRRVVSSRPKRGGRERESEQGEGETTD